MKKSLFFKSMSVVLVIVLVLGMGACSTTAQTQTDADTNNPFPIGMLLLVTDAVLQIEYNAEGKVTAVTGANEQGLTVADAYTDFAGKDCATAVSELIQVSADNGYLPESVKTVVLKQMLGSKLPNDRFLEDLTAQAQSALGAVGSVTKVVTVSAEQLNEKGYIGPETVQALLQNYLGVEKLEKYSGVDVPDDNLYSCSLVIDGTTRYYDINADTGIITELADHGNEDVTVDAPDVEDDDSGEGSTDSTDSTLELNIVSFNIRTISSDDTGVKSWEQRSLPLAQYLIDLNADIICMQESGKEKQYNFLKDALGDAYELYLGSDGKSAGNVVALRRDTFQVLEKEVFWLSETPQVYSIGWDAKHPRICQYFSLRHIQTGKVFNLFNTHLDHQGSIAPVRSMELITERIKNSTAPSILTGDFNESEQSETYKIAMKVLQDTQKTAPVTDSGSTYNRWGKNSDEGLPVDFIMVSQNVTPLSFRICRERWNDTNLYSDHYAVQATIRLPN